MPRVPLDEVHRTMEDMQGQRADAQARQNQESLPEIPLNARVDQSAPRLGREVAQVSSDQVLGARTTR